MPYTTLITVVLWFEDYGGYMTAGYGSRSVQHAQPYMIQGLSLE